MKKLFLAVISLCFVAHCYATKKEEGKLPQSLREGKLPKSFHKNKPLKYPSKAPWYARPGNQPRTTPAVGAVVLKNAVERHSDRFRENTHGKPQRARLKEDFSEHRIPLGPHNWTR